MRRILNKILTAFRREKKFILYEDLHLPTFRSNQGLNSNEAYLQSGIEQINYLKENNMISETTNLLDFGCGQGRLLNSLKYSKTKIHHYTGVDTQKKSIDWSLKHLLYSDNIRFIHLPAFNARYNPEGKGLMPLPFELDTFDLIFLNSVFSHMLTDDVVFYLGEFHRILKSGGKVYLTGFIEENVPDEEVNPDGYLSKSSSVLYRVRYEKNFFFSLAEKANFHIQAYHNQLIQRTKQSVIVLNKV